MAKILHDKIKERLAEIPSEEDMIIVLKGIPLSYFDEPKISVEKMMKNKLKYFMNMEQKERKIILYEEYLCLSTFIEEQYKIIHILDNNLYINLYPLYAELSDEIINGLKNHFNNDLQGEQVATGDIDEYIKVYANLVEIENVKFVVYNEGQDEVAQNEKIRRTKIFTVPEVEIPCEILSEEQIDATGQKFFDVSDETDYIAIVKAIFNEVDEIHVNDENSTIDAELFSERIRILAGNWNNTTDIYSYKVEQVSKKRSTNPAFTEILNKYWGKRKFLPLKVYDMAQLDEQIKQVKELSQEDIIADLVSEVEKCVKNEVPRDLFVTAPTGAGKSAMFQIPAIYLAEKYGLMTIVISPLIGLMNDQVKNLEIKKYEFARTINSDISPIIKQEIIDAIADGKCHILYISPETLLSRSDIEQLIGTRNIGMIVIDEAHIVTTWGKQFRPDYWYLGDHIRKLRKAQRENKEQPFVIATFTATAIHGGVEDMYRETIQSLHMLRPISYLGYVKRDDIDICIEHINTITQRTEYELQKFDHLIDQIIKASITDKKTLIYFPTVALIERFYEHCLIKNVQKFVAKYHGQLDRLQRRENYERFYNGERVVMLATKAFGMGIDIDDIQIVIHFAPTGNVCDYVQEIGRAARRPDLQGKAVYRHMSNDFKHINRLHGLSMIQKYQLTEVVKKIYELHRNSIMQQGVAKFTKKRNEMLVDAESFAYIFDGPMADENNNINKVKTAMLIIQKDFENRYGYAPFYVRPVPMFAIGYFAITPAEQKVINKNFGCVLEEVDSTMNICRVDLKLIWESGYNQKMSFPKFKYFLYTKNHDLDLVSDYAIVPALSVDVFPHDDFRNIFRRKLEAIQTAIFECVMSEKFYSDNELAEKIKNHANCSVYHARNIYEIILASMSLYMKSFGSSLQSRLFSTRPLQDGNVKYKFNNSTDQFFKWIEKGFAYILANTREDRLYLLNVEKNDTCKEYLTILGILEALDVLTFKTLGGASSQIYIYVNETKTMKNIFNNPNSYRNRLLDAVGQRHNLSVVMLAYLFQNNFSSKQIWDIIEDYFVGIIPEEVKKK